MILDIHPTILTLIISMLIQAIFFSFAATLKTDKVTDLSYGLTFIIITVYLAIMNSENVGLIEVLLAAMTIIWGVRIASYLLIRIIKTGRDKRFDDKRDDPVKFGMFWLLQGISVWVIMIPVVYMLTRTEAAEFNLWVVFGGIIWAVGLIIETIADLQLYKFRFSGNTNGKWIDSGLWHFSRHPNYFGEMLVWWGVFIYGISIYQGAGWLSVVGPISITILLRYVSGVPLLEKANNKRWGNDRAYAAYRDSTNLIILGQKKK